MQDALLVGLVSPVWLSLLSAVHRSDVVGLFSPSSGPHLEVYSAERTSPLRSSLNKRHYSNTHCQTLHRLVASVNPQETLIPNQSQNSSTSVSSPTRVRQRSPHSTGRPAPGLYGVITSRGILPCRSC
ncbi:hypothetical protein EV126DRAFT_44407 [Verticillium dahliae]|nr:hypothetical protein EV126DRAFT_44407 [Verticillium dahliae]